MVAVVQVLSEVLPYVIESYLLVTMGSNRLKLQQLYRNGLVSTKEQLWQDCQPALPVASKYILLELKVYVGLHEIRTYIRLSTYSVASHFS